VRRAHVSSWVGTAVQAFPSRVGAGLIDLFLRHQRPRSGSVAWRELVASLRTELDPVPDTEGTLEQYRQLDAQVLLMYGSETDPMFVDCTKALHSVLPHSTVLGLPGLNHDSAQTYGKRRRSLRRCGGSLRNERPDRERPDHQCSHSWEAAVELFRSAQRGIACPAPACISGEDETSAAKAKKADSENRSSNAPDVVASIDTAGVPGGLLVPGGP
jgi:hypothetical protein